MAVSRKLFRNYIPFKAFFLSRLGLFLLVYVSLVFIPVKGGGQHWHAFPHNRFLDGWARFDSGWYAMIVRLGYKNIPMGNGQDTNFFPLYPMTVRVASRLFGNVFLAGLVVSNLAFLLALIGLYRLVKTRYGADVARRATYLMAFNPFSFFYSAVYTEALFLFFVVFSFLFFERGRYLLAGVCAAGAGATRNVGGFAAIGLGLLVVEQVVKKGETWHPRMAWVLLGFAGTLGYVAYLTFRFGDPLLFLHAQKAWGTFNPSDTLRHILETFKYAPLREWGGEALFLFHLLLGFAAIYLVIKERNFLGGPYAAFALLLILPSFLRFTSLGRYLMVAFPLFVALGKVTGGKGVYRFTLFAEGFLLALFAILFSHWYWVA